ncbi:porin family protein [Cytophagales bacterium LB-30]|uniref:Porin family protein n=1 Tax=Shiella aurantiaca TaxID=3058365 RepID=A0ABT8F8E6_9BACT|nr:porin family protein [Shiella aurantiaca]MDN4166712.1 porin family protein [Shiella aurantiaca]
MRQLLAVTFFMVVALTAQAQVSIGIKVAPALSTNRVTNKELDYDFSTNGLGARLVIGPTFDIYLADNYDFHTGILFVPKYVGISRRFNATDAEVKERYKLQYLQIPLALKLYTDEIAIDKKIYFVIGGTTDIKIYEEPSRPSNFLITDFRTFDFTALIGAGLQLRVGPGTTIEAGFSYGRGLVNIARDTDNNLNHTLKNDMLNLDLTIKF